MIRSLMFLPGNTPNMLINGDTLGADALILDLEDAVSPSEKDSARVLVRNYLKNLKVRKQFFIVRINSTDTDYWQDDLSEIIPVKPDCIMPTKVNGDKMLNKISDFISSLDPEGNIKLLPLIETAEGVENAFNIASANNRIFGIALG
ncbi:MAG: CoA ester lyase, partial [Synergistaceae bacterium]|nr:CoA ester lyase [Synergistaceae bacterium]